MTKTFRFQSLALVASMGLCALISGCNPDEAAKPTTPPPTSPPASVGKPAPGPKADMKTPPAATAPTKPEEKKAP